MSPNQLTIELITENNKNFQFHFCRWAFVGQMTPNIVILWKENKNLQKRGKFAKLTKIGCMKPGFSKKKDHLRKIKPLLHSKR